MRPHLKRSIFQACLKIERSRFLENRSYEQSFPHLERQMELNGLETEETVVKTQLIKTQKSRRQYNTTEKLTTRNETTNIKKQFLMTHFKTTSVAVVKAHDTKRTTAPK